MKIIARILPAAILLAAIPLTGFAQPRGAGRGERGPFGQIAETLTDEQKDAIRELHTEHQKKMIDHRAEMDEVMEELNDLYMENASESQIMNKIEEIGKLRTEADKERAKLALEVRDLLTEEQKQMLEEAGGIMGLRGLMGGHGGHGGPRGHHPGPRPGGGPGEPGGEGLE
ncbi:periplasmic heavy metal sensor [candidate division WOR-3 bacterium]|uniref:Periplasmic heavy metal sensor n=1 Tax=candidate division WOR-3 bacterium TaxID=2052148 RepID=A0A9D5K846_UNCW3|nr:periplasmic heavy metal sensor [candidate division WOR-3 bacterium]MBD3364022.1 periplasmic heavy metal sensor [candidate division WOR-3 bacterium]